MDQNNINQMASIPKLSVQEQMLLEIHENTRKTKNYAKWQLIITVALVVIPLLAGIFIIPIVLQSLTASYGSVLQ